MRVECAYASIIQWQRIINTSCTYLLGIVSIHLLFKVGCRVAHDYHSVFDDVRQVYVVAVLVEPASSSADLLADHVV